MIVHDLGAIYPNLQIAAAGVAYIGLYLDVIILAACNWIGVGPERKHLDVAGRVARIQTGRAISSDNLQLIADELDREWRGRMRT